LIRAKDALPEFNNFQTKYGFVENEIRNNFPFWNFSKFGIEFELKKQGSSRVWNSREIYRIWLGFSRIDEIWLRGSWLHLDDK
jgi:hypothetical protein